MGKKAAATPEGPTVGAEKEQYLRRLREQEACHEAVGSDSLWHESLSAYQLVWYDVPTDDQLFLFDTCDIFLLSQGPKSVWVVTMICWKVMIGGLGTGHLAMLCYQWTRCSWHRYLQAKHPMCKVSDLDSQPKLYHFRNISTRITRLQCKARKNEAFQILRTPWVLGQPRVIQGCSAVHHSRKWTNFWLLATLKDVVLVFPASQKGI